MVAAAAAVITVVIALGFETQWVRQVATTLIVAAAAVVFIISCDHAREMKGGLTRSTCFHLSALAFPSPPLCLYPLACIDLVIGPVLVAAAGESGSVSIDLNQYRG
jgi:hypothetical protein